MGLGIHEHNEKWDTTKINDFRVKKKILLES